MLIFVGFPDGYGGDNGAQWYLMEEWCDGLATGKPVSSWSVAERIWVLCLGGVCSCFDGQRFCRNLAAWL